jgi:hypothetical protein
VNLDEVEGTPIVARDEIEQAFLEQNGHRNGQVADHSATLVGEGTKAKSSLG